MRVTLRKKPVRDGTQLSLYLDIYPPPAGVSRYDFLRLYLHADPRTTQERQHNRDTLQLAEDIRATRHREITEGTYKEVHPGAGTTVAQLIEREAKRRREQTRRSWMWMLQHVKSSGVSDVTLDRLTGPMIVKVRDHFVSMTRRKELSESSAKTYFQHFRTAIRAAYKSGLLTEDLSVRTSTIKAKSAERRALTLDELGAMAKTPIKRVIVWRVGMFSALTGLRISDIRELRWSHVIDEHGASELRFVSIKTRKFEVMPISSQARQVLGDRPADAGLVFPYIPAKSSLTKWIRVWASSADVSPDGLTIHCMRHTFATLQIAAGTDIYTVSKLLGHSSVNTTAIYAKMVDQQKRAAADRLVIPVEISSTPPLKLVK